MSTILRVVTANVVLITMAVLYIRIINRIQSWYMLFFYLLVITVTAALIYVLDWMIVKFLNRKKLKELEQELPYVKETFLKSLNPGLGGLFYAVASLMVVGGFAILLGNLFW